MTDYNKVLQAEIDKVQGYVNGKLDFITIAEVQLGKDKTQLVELQNKLDELLAEKESLREFNEWKNSKAKITKSKSSVVTGSIKDDKVDVGKTVEEKIIADSKKEEAGSFSNKGIKSENTASFKE